MYIDTFPVRCSLIDISIRQTNFIIFHKLSICLWFSYDFTLQLCLTMTVAFFVVWLPYAIVNVVQCFMSVHENYLIVVSMLIHLYPMINPAVHYMFNRWYRKTVVKYICCRCLRHGTQSQATMFTIMDRYNSLEARTPHRAPPRSKWTKIF